jgi:hypothetical protein
MKGPRLQSLNNGNLFSHLYGGNTKVSAESLSPWLPAGCLLPVSSHGHSSVCLGPNCLLLQMQVILTMVLPQ